MTDKVIFKLAKQLQWNEAEAAGVFYGAPIDLQDGYIHFSTAGQMRETAAKHFAGQGDLVLAAIDTAALGDKLVYEVSRGGALFPHLYAPLELKHVIWVKPLPLDDNGVHVFPDVLV
jgi:uncharacterized protein (DUF952 family)